MLQVRESVGENWCESQLRHLQESSRKDAKELHTSNTIIPEEPGIDIKDP
jgi:hypothetical protein